VWLAGEGSLGQALQGGTDDIEQGAKDLRAGLLELLPKDFFVLALILRNGREIQGDGAV
jgi:hypothetical protein